MFIQTKIIAVLLVLILAMGYGGYWYHEHMQQKFADLNIELAHKKLAFDAKQKELNAMQEDKKLQDTVRAGADTKITASRKVVEKARRKFTGTTKAGEEISISRSAVVDTPAVEAEINLATAEQNRCFELLSGDALTEDEKNGKQTNTMCNEFYPISKSN